jgi:hypothetical protein
MYFRTKKCILEETRQNKMYFRRKKIKCILEETKNKMYFRRNKKQNIF